MNVVPALDLRGRTEREKERLEAMPANIEAEQALLGAVMYDNEAFQWAEDVEPPHFYEPFHQRLWAAMIARIGRGDLAEPIVLNDDLATDPAHAELGGLRYLADLVDRAPPASNAASYGRTIIDMFMRRELIRVAVEAEARARDPSEPARAHLEAVESELFSLAEERRREGGFQDFGSAVDGAMEAAAAAYERDGSVSGISTGLIDLDRKLGGLHPSDLLILAGRPSMGKTALATNIAYHVARAYEFVEQPDGTKKTVRGGVVGFFSLEMSAEQLAARLVSDVAGVPSDKVRRGEVEPHEFGKLRDAAAEIRALPLYIDATGGLPIAKLAARARRLKRRYGLDLIIVDYLQLARGSEAARKSGRVQEVSEITAALKALAKELQVPVVALSQLSRKVEERDDKRPQLADLRESGSIEQDADVVGFIYREAYYLGRAEPKPGSPEHLNWQEQVEECRNVAEVIIGKQRHGPIGTVKLAFNEDLTRFGNLAREGRFEPGPGVRMPYGGRDD